MPVIRMIWDEGADQALPLPSYETPGSAGADLRANLAELDRPAGITLAPMERQLIPPTGLRVEIPEGGFEMQIRPPRSGLALKHGISLPNTPGTIDSDYRGPLGVILINLSAEPFIVGHGERIAQAVIAPPVIQAGFQIVDSLGETGRGSGGFGSTGRK